MKKRLLEIFEDPVGKKYHLTDREREAARLASRGLITDEIAEIMKSNVNAVSALLRTVRYKTGMNKNDLVKHLIKQIDEVIK